MDIADLIESDTDLMTHVCNLDVALSSHFLQQAVPPPPGIRSVIELRDAEQGLQKRKRSAYSGFNQHTAYQDTAAKSAYVDVEVDNTHIRVHKHWRPAFIAVFVLSKVFLAASLYFYFKADSQAQEISRLKEEINQTVRK